VLNELILSLTETSKIVLMVTPLMILTEFFELKFKDRIQELITERHANQYLIASLLGAVPGCVGAFSIVSLYSHGLVGFGGLIAVMLATAGDEAFVMLAMVPDAALLIFATCIILGVLGGFSADKITQAAHRKLSQPCSIEIHQNDLNSTHFFKEHVYGHILRRHVPRMFLWIFFTLLAVDYLVAELNLESIVSSLPAFALFVLAALVGIIPESGPHLFFLTLYSRRMIPFSVLLVNTLSQDGHGLLPLLSYSVKDTVYVQVFTTSFSLIVGAFLFLLGA
jgi:hypothetical protein